MRGAILFLLVMSLLVGGCKHKVPADALILSPQSMSDRQLQTRIFDSGNERAILIACSQALQDIGFNLDEAETELGVLVGSKDRDATNAGQIASAIIFAALTGVAMQVDDHQVIRVSLVVRGLDVENEDAPGSDLTAEDIENVRKRVETALNDGLASEFPETLCHKISARLAKDTADTLANDLTTLMEVKDCPGKTAVRVTFQRVVFNTGGMITRAEQVNNPELYKQFYDKLSQSVFLEANEI